MLYNRMLDSFIRHKGYRAEEVKNIGKITKFITPAKFSNCLITEEKKSPSDPSIRPERKSAGIRTKYPNNGASTSQNQAISK